MIVRALQSELMNRLAAMPAVCLLGPRQSGKTTLAQDIGDLRPSVYLDLESPEDCAQLAADPLFYFRENESRLIILDEVQQMPDLFAMLRGVIDKGRRKGNRAGRFLLLGSASDLLLRQSESLAGRVAYYELPPFQTWEIEESKHVDLWLRGGFPEAFLASDGEDSFRWRADFIRTYLERDIPQLGPRIPAATLRRFWTMLAHCQGAIHNAAQLARGLEVDGKTIARYLDLLVDLMLVRRLTPYQANVGKRLSKSPKVYVRDSGLVHTLLNIGNLEELLSHPIVGASWEGFAVENLIDAAPPRTAPMYYRTSAGAEIDLLLDIPGHGMWAIEVKRGATPRVEKGFHFACDDVKPAKRFLVTSGHETYRMPNDIEVTTVLALSKRLRALR